MLNEWNVLVAAVKKIFVLFFDVFTKMENTIKH